MSAAGDKLIGAAREAQLLGRIDKLTADRDKWRRMETEAAKYVETVICLRTGFTGEPPHVGWKGLGLALTEALDERDALRAEVARLTAALAGAWQPIETAPRDGREILCFEDGFIRVCYPKLFPRPIVRDDDMTVSKPGDIWEYFRDDENAPGHTWSMTPTHWQPLPEPPALSDPAS